MREGRGTLPVVGGAFRRRQRKSWAHHKFHRRRRDHRSLVEVGSDRLEAGVEENLDIGQRSIFAVLEGPKSSHT